MTLEESQVELFKLFVWVVVLVIGLTVFEFYRILNEKDYLSFWKRFTFIIMAFQLFSFLTHSIWNFSTESIGVAGIILRFWKIQGIFLILTLTIWNINTIVAFAAHPIKFLNDLWDKHGKMLKECNRKSRRNRQ